MLRVMKNSGRVTSRANDGQRGTRGRVDFQATTNSDGTYSVEFVDYGNYGKNRWDAKVVIPAEELKSMISLLQKLSRGDLASTLPEFVAPVAEEAPATEVAAATSDEAQALAASGAPPQRIKRKARTAPAAVGECREPAGAARRKAQPAAEIVQS